MQSEFHKKIIILISCCSLFLCLNSCNGQTKVDDCELSYKKATNNLNAYYKNNNKSLLKESLDNIESSLKCKETRLQAIDLKISLLALLKNYREGYIFVESLNEKDFKKKYKKQMNFNLFKGMEYESKGDTINAFKLYKATVKDINDYIKSGETSQEVLDQEAYYDLFFIKSRVSPQGQINVEINELIQKHPSDKDFLTTLKSSFSEESKEVNPTFNKD